MEPDLSPSVRDPRVTLQVNDAFSGSLSPRRRSPAALSMPTIPGAAIGSYASAVHRIADCISARISRHALSQCWELPSTHAWAQPANVVPLPSA